MLSDFDAFIDEYENILDNKKGESGDMRLVDMLHHLVLLDKFLQEQPNAQTMFHHMSHSAFNLVLESPSIDTSQVIYTLQANLFTLVCAILHMDIEETMNC